MGRHESPRGVDGTLANDYYQSSRGVERRREAIEPGGRSGEASRRRKKKGEEIDPEVRELLEKILEETTAGDPMSLLRWTSNDGRRGRFP